MREKRKAYVAFEGGGARGFVHVASLSAIEKLDQFDVRGYAGTSAGALMAALAAVGYTSKDLISISKEPAGDHQEWVVTSVLSDLKVEKATDLFGGHWWLIWLVRLLYKNRWPLWIVVAVFAFAFLTVILGWVSSWSGPGATPFLGGHWIYATGIAVFCLASLAAVYAIVRFAREFRGIVPLDEVKGALDRAMIRKMIKDDAGDFAADHRLTFGELHAAGKTLKIVAANLNSGEMRLFSTDSASCRNIPVSDAVAASIAVPVLFIPQKVEGQDYCDGGIVSNLPAWVFEEETVNDANALVIASHIADIAPHANFGNGFGLIERIARTAAFGGKSLNMRGIRGLITVEVGSMFRLLDFDYEKKSVEFLKDYYKAYSAALLQLRNFLAEDRFLEDVFEKYKSKFHDDERIEGDMQLRASLVREIGLASDHATPYQLSCCLGFEGDADRFLSVRHRDSMIQKSIVGKCPVFLDLEDTADMVEFRRLDDDGLIWDRTPDNRKWSLVIPLDQPAARDCARTVAVAFDGAVSLHNVKDTYIDDMKAHVLSGWDRK